MAQINEKLEKLLKEVGEVVDLKDRSSAVWSLPQNQSVMIVKHKALEKISNNYKIILYTDSKYVKDGITIWILNWKKNNWKNSQKKDVKNKDLWLRLDILSQKFDIDWVWVKGHSDNIENNIADSLATSAINN